MPRTPSDGGTGARCEGCRGSLTVFVSERQLERVFQQGLQHAVSGRQEGGVQRERPRHGRWGLPAAAGRGPGGAAARRAVPSALLWPLSRRG